MEGVNGGRGGKGKSVKFSTIQINFKKYCKKYKQNEEWEGSAFLFLFHLWEGRLRLEKAVSGGH